MSHASEQLKTPENYFSNREKVVIGLCALALSQEVIVNRLPQSTCTHFLEIQDAIAAFTCWVVNPTVVDVGPDIDVITFAVDIAKQAVAKDEVRGVTYVIDSNNDGIIHCDKEKDVVRHP